MARYLTVLVVVVLLLSANTTHAALLLSRSVDLRVYNRNLAIPVKLLAVAEAGDGGAVGFSLAAEVTEVLDAVTEGISSDINRRRDCAQKWNAANARTWIADNKLNHSIDVSIEVSLCVKTPLGRARTTLWRETAHIGFSIAPRLEAGIPKLDLADFEVRGLSKVARLVNGRQMIRRKLESQIETFNNNPSLVQLPQKVAELGLRYSSVRFNADSHGQTLQVDLEGDLDSEVLAGLIGVR